PAIGMTVYTVRQLGCGLGAVADLPKCAQGDVEAMAKRLSNEGGAIGSMMAEVASDEQGRFRHADGVLSDNAPAEMVATEVKTRRCFVTDGYTVGAFGLHPVTPGDRTGDFSIDRWLTSADLSARAVAAQSPASD